MTDSVIPFPVTPEPEPQQPVVLPDPPQPAVTPLGWLVAILSGVVSFGLVSALLG